MISCNNMVFKKELRQKLNVCASTLRKLLNVVYFDDLEKIGYHKTQHQLTPKQYAYLIDALGVND